LKFCSNGLPGWSCSPYQVGDIGPAGGFVFYISAAGMHGLEAAPMDLAAIDSDFWDPSIPGWGATRGWGCMGTSIPTSTAFGTGHANTQAIMDNCPVAPIAARWAADYSLNGFSDWYLPSNDELVLLYQKSNFGSGEVPGFIGTVYWSSSQSDANYVWYVAFGTGMNYPSAIKDNNPLRIRPIRSF
jgi:hypothetical protein